MVKNRPGQIVSSAVMLACPNFTSFIESSLMNNGQNLTGFSK